MARVETRVEEELPGGASEHEAMEGVIRPGGTGLGLPVSLAVVAVFPNQQVGEGKCVGVEVEPPLRVRERGTSGGATRGHEGQQDERAPPGLCERKTAGGVGFA